MLTLLVGVGNPWRGDDAAGLEVARRVRALGGPVEVREIEGDASSLVDAWAGSDRVAVVDAARSGAAPGTVHVFRADLAPIPATLCSSTHAFGVADAIELSRALGRLPRRLDVYAVEGRGLRARRSAVARGGAARRGARRPAFRLIAGNPQPVQDRPPDGDAAAGCDGRSMPSPGPMTAPVGLTRRRFVEGALGAGVALALPARLTASRSVGRHRAGMAGRRLLGGRGPGRAAAGPAWSPARGYYAVPGGGETSLNADLLYVHAAAAGPDTAVRAATTRAPARSRCVCSRIPPCRVPAGAASAAVAAAAASCSAAERVRGGRPDPRLGLGRDDEGTGGQHVVIDTAVVRGLAMAHAARRAIGLDARRGRPRGRARAGRRLHDVLLLPGAAPEPGQLADRDLRRCRRGHGRHAPAAQRLPRPDVPLRPGADAARLRRGASRSPGRATAGTTCRSTPSGIRGTSTAPSTPRSSRRRWRSTGRGRGGGHGGAHPNGTSATIRAWLDRVLCGYWTHAGYLNWDTGLSFARWHQAKKHGLCLPSLMAIALARRAQAVARPTGAGRSTCSTAASSSSAGSSRRGGGIPPAVPYGITRHRARRRRRGALRGADGARRRRRPRRWASAGCAPSRRRRCTRTTPTSGASRSRRRTTTPRSWR